jgi:serine/threonine protein kinase
MTFSQLFSMATSRELSQQFLSPEPRALILATQSNILVADDLRCCLSDLGLASVIETQSLNASVSNRTHGTLRWMAPELIDPNAFPGYDSKMRIKADIYSFGCTMLEVSWHRPMIACLVHVQPRSSPENRHFSIKAVTLL